MKARFTSVGVASFLIFVAASLSAGTLLGPAKSPIAESGGSGLNYGLVNGWGVAPETMISVDMLSAGDDCSREYTNLEYAEKEWSWTLSGGFNLVLTMYRADSSASVVGMIDDLGDCDASNAYNSLQVKNVDLGEGYWLVSQYKEAQQPNPSPPPAPQPPDLKGYAYTNQPLQVFSGLFASPCCAPFTIFTSNTKIKSRTYVKSEASAMAKQTESDCFCIFYCVTCSP